MNIKTKFNIGDKVWTIDHDSFYKFTITDINCRVYKDYGGKIGTVISYNDGTHDTYDYYGEHRVKATKEELSNLL